MNRTILLRALLSGPRALNQLHRALPAMRRTQVAELVTELVTEGLAAGDSRGYRLTEAGRRTALASMPQAVPMREYRPDRPFRRAGSERASRLPSVAAGVRYWPRGANRE